MLTRLTKSLFPLALVNLLIGVVGLPFLLTQSGRPSASLYVALLGFWLGLCGLFLSRSESAWAESLQRWLAPPRHWILGLLAWGLTLAGLWIGGFWLAEGESARLSRFGVVVILWALVAVGVLVSLLGALWQKSARLLQPLLTGIGVVALMLMGMEGLLRVYDRLGGEDAPSTAQVDSQPETWNIITDTVLPWAEQFWLEQQLAAREVSWTPYVYWRMQPYQGDYVNVDERGLRVSLPAPRQPADLSIHFFGGSTMWGYGGRDPHTIPSEVVWALEAQGISAQASNFGEFGYNSRQDLTLFQSQLALGNIPDVAVFYWGFNDVNLAYLDGYIGLTGGEKDRGAQFEGVQCQLDLSVGVLSNGLLYKTELGSRLLEWRGILPLNPAEGCALGNADWANVNTALVARQSNDPTLLAQHIQAMTRLTIASAQAYGVTPIIIWQPTIFQKSPRAWYEEQIVAQERWRVFGEYYLAVDAEVRRLLAATPEFLIWSDYFSGGDPTQILFIDKVHVTEEGNAWVAAGIAEEVLRLRP
jgi:lysophospholipase L1-like esterase